MKVLSLALLSFAVGCASVQGRNEKPYYNYRAEMLLTVDGQTFEGLAVTRLLGATTISITSPITLNRVEVSSCSRHEVIRNTSKGWFGTGGVTNQMIYTYTPTELETMGHCPLFFQAFNDHVQKSWGMVAFKSDQSLPAHMDCNGIGWNFSGITVCQTKAGLEQEISFKAPVQFEASPSCKVTSADKMKFQVRSDVGWCKATFSDGRLFHDLIQLGYGEVTVY